MRLYSVDLYNTISLSIQVNGETLWSTGKYHHIHLRFNGAAHRIFSYSQHSQ